MGSSQSTPIPNIHPQTVLQQQEGGYPNAEQSGARVVRSHLPQEEVSKAKIKYPELVQKVKKLDLIADKYNELIRNAERIENNIIMRVDELAERVKITESTVSQLVKQVGCISPCTQNIRVASWNVAGVNNNPFEYWMPSNEKHTELMKKFEDAVLNPVVTVRTYFDQKKYNLLLRKMGEIEIKAVDQEKSDIMGSFYNEISSLSMEAFATNTKIKESRLLSYPDRFPRPRLTAIRYDLNSSIDVWYDAWLNDMFEKTNGQETGWEHIIFNNLGVDENGKSNKRSSKYKLIGDDRTADEQLQVLGLAVMDTIFFSILHELRAEETKTSILASLSSDKTKVIGRVLQRLAMDSDLICLQEVNAKTIQSITPRGFGFVVPRNPKDIPQDSAILYRESIFDKGENIDLEFRHSHWDDDYPGPVYDLVNDSVAARLTLKDRSSLVVVSYHAQSEGLDSLQVVQALRNKGEPFILGIDANTISENKKGTLSVEKFNEELKGLQYATHNPTTKKSRTHFQAQMGKGVKYEYALNEKGEQKDYIVSNMKVISQGVVTGYLEPDGSRSDSRLLPALDFPSDHYIVKAIVSL